ncbi:MAG: hypothetical protein MUF30_11810, partial [Burkholderiales bacterium]|nr:hypothetical protein [Burkholderiales bacterium]
PLPALECEEARETAIGSGSYGPFEGTVQLVPTASGEATLVRAAANDGLRRRQRVRAVRGPVASSWVVVSPDVQPFTDVPLPPSTGIPGDSVEIQYGPTATGPWDSDFTPGVDVFRRERVGTGPWSTPQRIVGLDGAPGTPGTPGTPGASVETQYGPTATGPWDSDFTPGVDLFMRQRVGTGPWSAGIRIVGEQGPPGADGDPGTPGTPGAPGNYFDFRFRRAASQPATPTGNTPAGWDDAPPAGTEPLWFIRGEKTAAGALIGTWSTPVRLSGEGAGNGDPIFLGLGALANYSTSVIEVGYGFRSDIAAAAPTITVTYRVRSTGQGVPIGAPNTPQTITGGPTGVTINAAYIDANGQFNAEVVMTVSVAVNGVTLTSEFTGAQFLWG